MSLQNNNNESGFVDACLENKGGRLHYHVDSSATLKNSTASVVATGENANINVHLHQNPSESEKVNLNSLVLFINRQTQLTQLNERLNRHTEFTSPLFCVSYGCKYEVLDNFILRLAREYHVKASLLPEKRIPSKPLPENANTLIFWRSYDGATCRKYGVQRILDEFLNEWLTYPFKKRNKPVVFCLQLQHTPKRWLLDRWRKDWKKEMCDYLTILSKLSEAELKREYYTNNILILDELQPVKFEDVRNWLVEFFLNPEILDGTFVNDVEDKIYKKQHTVSMHRLIKALRNLLKDNLSSQG